MILEEVSFLEKSIENFNITCVQLSVHTTKLKCNSIGENQIEILRRLTNTNKFLQSFFSKTLEKRSWKFWNWMDDDDRVRVDMNTDKLRQNDEKLKFDIEHQNAALDKMYNFLNDTAFQAEEISNGIINNFEILKNEMKQSLNFTFIIKKMFYLEATLVEMTYWIESLIDLIEYRQKIFLNIILNHKYDTQILINTLGNNFFDNVLIRMETTLPDGIIFPKTSRSNIDPLLWRAITFNYKLINQRQMEIIFKIPLVKEILYKTKQVITHPGFNNSVVAILNLKYDILIYEDINLWGYLTNKQEYNKCIQLQSAKLCYLSTAQTNLKTNEDCLIEAIWRKNFNNCEIKHFIVKHDLWFATTNKNEWIFISPNYTPLKIIENNQITFNNISGYGKIILKPGMTIETKNVHIDYFSEMNVTIIENETTNSITIEKTKLENWMQEYIPEFNNTFKTIDFINHKELFDIGIDINTLEKHQTILENLMYIPYKYPWWATSGTLLFLIVIVLVCILRFKGTISCCSKQELITKKPDKVIIMKNDKESELIDNPIIKETTFINENEKQRNPRKWIKNNPNDKSMKRNAHIIKRATNKNKNMKTILHKAKFHAENEIYTKSDDEVYTHTENELIENLKNEAIIQEKKELKVKNGNDKINYEKNINLNQSNTEAESAQAKQWKSCIMNFE